MYGDATPFEQPHELLAVAADEHAHAHVVATVS
jgi:hypothetical protein